MPSETGTSVRKIFADVNLSPTEAVAHQVGRASLQITANTVEHLSRARGCLVLPHLILTATHWVNIIIPTTHREDITYSPHSTDEKSETQRGQNPNEE